MAQRIVNLGYQTKTGKGFKSVFLEYVADSLRDADPSIEELSSTDAVHK